MKYLMLCFAMLIGLSSCKKEELESKLPPETTTGKNTAGFIVDGKTVILPSESYSSVPGSGLIKGLVVQTGPNAHSENNSQYFTIQIANSANNPSHAIYIRIHEYPREGTYAFGKFLRDNYVDGPNYPQSSLIISGKGSETQWYYSKSNSGSITFNEVDNNLKICSGTFKATLYNRFDENKTIEITKGRFDIDLNK